MPEENAVRFSRASARNFRYGTSPEVKTIHPPPVVAGTNFGPCR